MISIAFPVFFALVFFFYWGPGRHSALTQNRVLLIFSLFFYAWMDLRFLGLMLAVVFIAYQSARAISNFVRGRAVIFFGSLSLLVGILVCFKYFHFFLPAEAAGWTAGNENFSSPVLTNLVLPLGISFYIFQAIGYLTDVYQEKMPASTEPVSFAVYIAYFGKITAGPIERAAPFLTQLRVKRVFDYSLASEGARQVLWGLMVKLVVADNCAFIAEPVLENHHSYSGSTLLTAAFFYAFEVYGDFSGYSNLAIGLSKLLGLRLTKNFSAPFLSTNIRDFWSRWHITLTAWMTDYVFTPLNFYLRSWRKTGVILSTVVTFVLIGAWHGSNASFILFGLIHGFFFIVFILTDSGRGKPEMRVPQLIAKTGFVFFIVMIALIAFGAGSIKDAGEIWKTIFSSSIFKPVVFPDYFSRFKVAGTLGCILFLMTCEYWQRRQKNEFQFPAFFRPWGRAVVYTVLILAILLLGSTVHVDFIYSQF